MSCGGTAYFSMAWPGTGRLLGLLALLLPASALPAGTAAAADTLPCAGMSLGRLEVAPASGTRSLAPIDMQAGDTLAISFQADPRVQGTVILVAGDGREQRLDYGPHATQLSYTAEHAGILGVRLAATGGKAAIFALTCGTPLAWDAMLTDGVSAKGTPLPVPGSTTATGAPASAVAPAGDSPLQWLGGAPDGQGPAPGRYGLNLKLQPALTVGLLAQFEPPADPMLGPSALSDQPWQVGPVTSLNLGSGLSLEAQAAWGSADPIIGAAAERQTVDARLKSSQTAGAWRFSPSIGFSHVHERLAAVDAADGDLPGHQALDSGRIEIKPELSYRIDAGASTYVEPRLMLGTVWSLGDAAAAGSGTGGPHEPRQITETGVTVGTADGTRLQIGGTVEEGDVASERVWSGRLQLNIPLK